MSGIGPVPGKQLPILCLPEVHPAIVKFLQLPNIYKKTLIEKLRRLHAKPEFPSDTEDGILKVKCTLTFDDLKNYRKLETNQAKLVEKILGNWEYNVRKVLSETKGDLHVDDSLHCPVEIFQQLVQVLSQNPSFNLAADKGCALFIDITSKICTIVGEKVEVKRYATVLRSEIDALKKATYDKNDPISKRLGLSKPKIEFLRQTKALEKKVANGHMTLDTINDCNVLVVCSTEDIVDIIMGEVKSVLKEMVRGCIACSPVISSLLQKSKAEEVIKRKLNDLRNSCIWYVTKDKDIVVLGRQQEKVEECKQVILKKIKRKEFCLMGEESNLFFSKDGQKEIERLSHEWSGLTEIREDVGFVEFAACEAAFADIEKSLRRLINEKGIFSEFVEIPVGVLVYFQEQMSKEYETLYRQCSEVNVDIALMRKSAFGFQLTGTHSSRKIIKDRLKELVNSVRFSCHFLKGLGLHLIFLSQETLTTIRQLEMKYQCVLDYDGRNLEKKFGTVAKLPSVSSIEPDATPEVTLDGPDDSIQTTVVVGALTEQDAEVIVVNSNSKLELDKNPVSNRVLAAAGATIQAECEANFPEGIQIGQLAETSSGELSCNSIYHGLLLTWDGGKRESERVMRIFVLKCLQKASDDGVTSLAFPALGVEDLDYPTSFVAHLMFECLDTFRTDHPDTSLKRVTIAVQSEHQYEEFRTAKLGSESQEKEAKEEEITSGFLACIGCLEVKFITGEITTETTDALIIDDQYYVSRGDDVRKKIESSRNSTTLGRFQQHVVLTEPGVMQCRFVYHVTSKTSRRAWRGAILNCLKDAQTRKCRTIALSVFGIGLQGMTAHDRASDLLETAKKFAASEPSYLRHIRFMLPSEKDIGTCKLAAKKISSVTVSDDVHTDLTVTIYARKEAIEMVKKELNSLAKGHLAP